MTAGRPGGSVDWHRYLEHFHNERPGITEVVLSHARDGGQSPYQWLAEAVPADQVVLDLACGNGSLWPHLGDHGWVGLDSSTAELQMARGRGASQVVRADAAAVPLRSGAVGVVVCSMALMLLQPLSTALAELARVMRPGSTLVALLPSSRPLSPGDLARYAHLLMVLGRRHFAYPNDSELREPARALSHAGLALVSDQRRRFTCMVSNPEVGLACVRSLYLPGQSTRRLAAATRVTEKWVGEQIGLPLRRLVART